MQVACCGISSGQPVVARLALKPTSSIQIPGDTIDINGNPAEVITTGRHDPCVGVRATPIAEAMVAIVLLDHARSAWPKRTRQPAHAEYPGLNPAPIVRLSLFYAIYLASSPF